MGRREGHLAVLARGILCVGLAVAGWSSTAQQGRFTTLTVEELVGIRTELLNLHVSLTGVPLPAAGLLVGPSGDVLIAGGDVRIEAFMSGLAPNYRIAVHKAKPGEAAMLASGVYCYLLTAFTDDVEVVQHGPTQVDVQAGDQVWFAWDVNARLLQATRLGMNAGYRLYRSGPLTDPDCAKLAPTDYGLVQEFAVREGQAEFTFVDTGERISYPPAPPKFLKAGGNLTVEGHARVGLDLGVGGLTATGALLVGGGITPPKGFAAIEHALSIGGLPWGPEYVRLQIWALYGALGKPPVPAAILRLDARNSRLPGVDIPAQAWDWVVTSTRGLPPLPAPVAVSRVGTKPYGTFALLERFPEPQPIGAGLVRLEVGVPPGNWTINIGTPALAGNPPDVPPILLGPTTRGVFTVTDLGLSPAGNQRLVLGGGPTNTDIMFNIGAPAVAAGPPAQPAVGADLGKFIVNDLALGVAAPRLLIGDDAFISLGHDTVPNPPGGSNMLAIPWSFGSLVVRDLVVGKNRLYINVPPGVTGIAIGIPGLPAQPIKAGVPGEALRNIPAIPAAPGNFVIEDLSVGIVGQLCAGGNPRLEIAPTGAVAIGMPVPVPPPPLPPLPAGSLTIAHSLGVGTNAPQGCGDAQFGGNVKINQNLQVGGDAQFGRNVKIDRDLQVGGQALVDWLVVGELVPALINYWSFINPDGGPNLAIGPSSPPNLSQLIFTVLELTPSGDATFGRHLTVRGQLQLGGFPTAPEAVGTGALYFDTTAKIPFFYDGTRWLSLQGPQGPQGPAGPGIAAVDVFVSFVPHDQPGGGKARLLTVPGQADRKLQLELEIPKGPPGSVDFSQADQRYVLKPKDEADLTIGSLMSLGQLAGDWLAIGEPAKEKNFWSFINPDEGPNLALGVSELPNLSRLTLTVMEFERATGNVKILQDLDVDHDLRVFGYTDLGDLRGRDAEFDNVTVNRDLRVKGVKFFVQPHPTDPTKEIVYASLEGPEVGTYIRGEARLVNGEAVIMLPEHFTAATSEEGLTVQLTPIGEWLQLYVVELSPEELVVREAQEKSGRFFYLVQGLRKDYEGFRPIQRKE